MGLNILGRLRAAARAFAGGARFREAVGVTIDDDEDQWRRLTGASDRDLTPLTQERMRTLAQHLWESNLLANRLIELPLAYILAEGVSLTVADEEAQGWLDAFWRDPINAMAVKLPKKARELALFGEQCWPTFVNALDGHVRLGYLDPAQIETVVMDPDNPEQPIGIVTRRDRRGEQRRYRVIVNGPETVFTARTQAIRQTFTTGEAFYVTVNDLSQGRRGRSDLLAQIDWLDVYEQFLFGEAERSNFLRAFIWDVTLKGATPDEVARRAKEIVAPPPGAVRVHNDAEAWNAVTPDLKATEAAENARLFRNHILGGATVPEHWYGGASDVNRSTAGEMGEPTFKLMSARQTLWKHVLEGVGTYVIRQKLLAILNTDLDPAAPDPDYEVRAVFPELAVRDVSKYAGALQQVVSAVALGVEGGLLSEETAVATIATVAGRLGVEFDAGEELGRARADRAARAEADTFTPLPDDDPPPGDGGDGA